MVLSLNLFSCSNSSNGQDDTKKIIISSDVAAGLINGISETPSDTDDSFAIELITTYVDAEVLAVVRVKGNNIGPATFFAAQETFVNTPGFWNGPVFEGALLPLSVPEDVIWIGGTGGDESLPQLCINNGVLEIVDLLQDSEEKLTILVLGPLTDIVCVVLNFPQVLYKIEEIIFLAGRAPNQVLAYSFAPDVVFTDFNVAQATGTPGVYNGADNPCAGHSPDQGSGLNDESEQLWVDPSYIGQSRTVNSCISYVNQEELESFETGTIEVFCDGGPWAELP